jgi:gluconate 5-dehydrogenase
MQRPNFSLDGKVAVVTGASRGIGSALATALAQSGATVALLGRDARALAATADALVAAGCRAQHFCADIAVRPMTFGITATLQWSPLAVVCLIQLQI